MSNWFNMRVPAPKVRHSMFDLSNDYKTSFNMGQLIPNYVEDCVPSDKLQHLSSDIFLRMSPLQYPIMHRLKVRQHYFVTPYRLILGDELYEQFLNGQQDIVSVEILNDTANQINLSNGIFDYLGYDLTNVGKARFVLDAGDSFYIPNPVAALSYMLIWANWFADEVLDATFIDAVNDMITDYRTAMAQGVSMVVSASSTGFSHVIAVRQVSFEKDYFTCAQTDTQRGDVVPLVSGIYDSSYSGSTNALGMYFNKTSRKIEAIDQQGTEYPLTQPDTILDLWKREQVQRFKEVDNVFGTRTQEKLLGHWGVVSSDARLQKPQFIGGSQSYVQISEVMSLSDTEGAGLGSYAGKGVAFRRGKSVHTFIEEHSFIIGLISVIPDNGYCDGNPRYFYKQNIYDFASPEFNNIGYQSIYKGEVLSIDNVGTADLEDFGYQPRYSEYRQHKSIATGDFRSSATLLAWHLNRIFSSMPPLNGDFVHVSDDNTKRIYQTTSGQKLYLDVYHNVKMSRPISYMPSSMHL